MMEHRSFQRSQRGRLLLPLAIAMLISFAGLASATPGQLDPTFGINGRASANIPNYRLATQSLAIQPDGKIVAGVFVRGLRFPSGAIRYLADGGLDTAFGDNGKAVFADDMVSGNTGFAVAVQGDGKIVTAGRRVVRFNSDGSFDTTFDFPVEGGEGHRFDSVSSVFARNDGRIVVVGSFDDGAAKVVRYSAEGTLDPSFGNQGLLAIPASDNYVTEVAPQPDGRLVAARTVAEQLELRRFDDAGSLDSTFGAGGIATIHVGPVTDIEAAPIAYHEMVIRSDGKILIAFGRNESPTVSLMRYNADGSLDTSLDGDGIADIEIYSRPQKMVSQADGALLIEASNSRDYKLWRFRENGTLDSSFGNNGSIDLLSAPVNRGLWPIDLALQADGKILAATFLNGVDESYYDVVLTRYLSGVCGDNLLETGIEQCDDGNLSNGDGCDSNCTPTACGNGVISSGEACDDGNLVDGDDCDSNCRPTGCGNGLRTTGEACDDGNTSDGDGCESDCTYTPVSQTVGAGGTVTTDTGSTGATSMVPVQVSLTTPNAGLVSIAPPTQATVEEGLVVVGAELQIEAPAASAAAPLVLVIDVDASAIPTGVDAAHLDVTRNTASVAPCAGPGGVADPDPCVTSRTTLPSGDVQLTILTSHASLWSIVVRGLDESEQDCVGGVNQATVKVVKARAKLDAGCLKAAAKGQEADAQACLSIDPKGKVAAAALKTDAIAGESCTPPPPFGYASSSAANIAAQTAATEIMADLFGANLTATVIATETSKEGAMCQAKLRKAVQGLFDAEAGLFVKCKKAGLAGKSKLIVSAAQMEACFASLHADLSGKRAKTIAKINGALKACAKINLSAAVPVSCAGAGNFGSCIAKRVDCRLCRLFNAADSLGEDCDVFDNETADLSCP